MQESLKENSKKSFSFKNAWDFWENIKNEFLKVQWTDGEQVRVYAQVVVVATFLLGMGIYLVDVLIKNCLDFFETLLE